MMRRCLNEALAVARNRITFGETIIDHPLMRRQLLKIMVPTEQALSVFTYAAALMARADTGDKQAERLLRIVTPLLKFRACRDNVTVATAAIYRLSLSSFSARVRRRCCCCSAGNAGNAFLWWTVPFFLPSIIIITLVLLLLVLVRALLCLLLLCYPRLPCWRCSIAAAI